MKDVSGLLKIIIFLLLVLVFGSVVLYIAVAILGMYAIIFGIGIAIAAIVAAVTYMVNNKWHIKINDSFRRAGTKIRDNPGIGKVFPYIKWVVYACELFFVINLFVSMGQTLSNIVFLIFLVGIVLQIAFKDNRNLMYSTGIYAGICLFSLFKVAAAGGFWMYQWVSILNAIIFGLAALLAWRRIKSQTTIACISMQGSNEPADEIVQDAIASTDESVNVGDALEAAGEKKENKLLVALPFVLVILVCAGSITMQQLSPQVRYDKAIERNDIGKAVEIYLEDGEMKSVSNTSKMQAVIDYYVKEYIDENVEYGKVTAYFEKAYEVEDFRSIVESAGVEVAKIKDSRDAFAKAVKAEEENDLVTAVFEYSKVISEDNKNYEVAGKKIAELSPKVKEQALDGMKEKIEAGDLLGAKTLVESTLSVLGNDKELKELKKEVDSKLKSELYIQIKALRDSSDLTGAKELADEALKIYPTEKTFSTLMQSIENKILADEKAAAIAGQIVSVESTKIVAQQDSYKALYPDLLVFSVKNGSAKVVKNYTVAYEGKDIKGYFVEIQTKDDDSDNPSKTAVVKDANIQPGQISENAGLELATGEQPAALRACIVKVEFEDGSTWSNPYYEYWSADSNTFARSKSTTKKSSSSKSSSKPKTTDNDPDTDFEKYLKDNDPDSYDFYQELEKSWDSMR